MSATSPKSSSLAKLGFYPRQKALKVMVLGQSGVGKSAMVVRFITRRYIGEYDPTLEKIYTFHTVIDNEMMYFDILDAAGQPHETECLALEANIRWAEAFILMYSVTDKCSFDECYRLKFLINYNKRRRRTLKYDGIGGDVPVVLVGNKIDQSEDRMVSLEEGQRRSKEIGCVCFHEISVRESIEQVWGVFRDVCRFWRVQCKNPLRFLRNGGEKEPTSPDSAATTTTPNSARTLFSSAVSPGSLFPSSCRPSGLFSRRWTDTELEEEDEDTKTTSRSRVTSKEELGSCTSSPSSESISTTIATTPFRERASTDGHLLLQRPWRWRYPPSSSAGSSGNSQDFYAGRSNRRMSISMRGSNASY